MGERERMRECSIGARIPACGAEISHDKTYPEEPVVLLPQVNIAVLALSHTPQT